MQASRERRSVLRWAKAETDSESSRKATRSEGDNLRRVRLARSCNTHTQTHTHTHTHIYIYREREREREREPAVRQWRLVLVVLVGV